MHGGSIEVRSAVGCGDRVHGCASLWTRAPDSWTRGRATGRAESSLQGSAVAYVQEAMGWLSDADALERRGCPRAWPEMSRRKPRPTSAERKPVILLADDNADMRRVCVRLAGRALPIDRGGNGQDGAGRGGDGCVPDLVLTDVMMPEMDGFALLAALRQNPATRSVPVIMLSARAGEEARIDGIDAGADDYLTKPFSARELVARVDAQLKLARLRKEAVEQEAALNLEISKAKRFAWEALEHIPEVFYTFDQQFSIHLHECRRRRRSPGAWERSLLESVSGTCFRTSGEHCGKQASGERWSSGLRWNLNTTTSRCEPGFITRSIRCPTRASSCTRGISPRRERPKRRSKVGAAGGRGPAGGEHRARDQQSS